MMFAGHSDDTEKNRKKFTIVLEKKAEKDDHVFRDTALPFANSVTRKCTTSNAEKRDFPDHDTVRESSSDGNAVKEGSADGNAAGESSSDGNAARICSAGNTTMTGNICPKPDIPQKILAMARLYEYGDGSLLNKAQNLYRQGKFMEDYEDHVPWNGTIHRYFTTYHDLNLRQLRGYFTWRTEVRKGRYKPIATSLAYLYIYELLCGIGSASPEDTLYRIKSFEEGYLDSGIGDQGMRHNLHRWCLEYAVLHALPGDTVLQYADPVILEKDEALTILKQPGAYSDEEIFSALLLFGDKKLKDSPVLKSDADQSENLEEHRFSARGAHLFSSLWRYLSAHYQFDGKDIFAACFGEMKAYPWHPLSNAVYFEPYKPADMDFFLDTCRSYHLHAGEWKEMRYDPLYFDRDRLHAIFHEADRCFRRYLKTGHYIKAKPEEAWVTPCVEAVLEEEHQAELEAAKPKITIDFSRLEGIRFDARITRDSLLTDAEMAGDEEKAENSVQTETESPIENQAAADQSDLNPFYLQLLKDLLSGKSVERELTEKKLMPSIVTDTINEAFFDEVGDNILACDGTKITIVEDYKDEILDVLRSKS